MMDEVANQLARTGRLQVKARTLVAAQWRHTPDVLEAARSLNVAWVVHGNVRHAGAQLNHVFLAVHHFKRQIRPDTAHDHVDRVAPDIDGRNPQRR